MGESHGAEPTEDGPLYVGYYFDAETGLYHVRNRYYDTSLGRFISRDPIGYGDGMNLYQYVGGRPLTFTDPMGLEKFENDPQPNWDEGSGPLYHTQHELVIGIPHSCNMTPEEFVDDVYQKLSTFELFNDGNNTTATIRVNGNIGRFDLLGADGLASDMINDDEVAVRLDLFPRRRRVQATTLGAHQLVGVRRWEVHYWTDCGESPYKFKVSVKTEAYDRTRTFLNDQGLKTRGEAAQLTVWKQYFTNIYDHYRQVENCTPTILDQKALEGTVKDIGYIANPWGPNNQFVPEAPSPPPPRVPIRFLPPINL